MRTRSIAASHSVNWRVGRCPATLLQGVDLHRRVARKRIEVCVGVEYRRIGADGNRCDKTVDELADC